MGRPWTKSFKQWCIENNKLDMLKQLDIKLNSLSAEQFSWQSNKKLVWTCENNHSWEDYVCNRTGKNTKCPYCTGKRRIEGQTDLKTTHPDLCKDWDYSKNELGPENYSKGNHTEVWWKCHKCEHEWHSQIDRRTIRGCPKCYKGGTSFPEQTVYWWIKQMYKNASNRFILNKLEYDIVIPELRLLIEYDGYDTHRDKRQRHIEKLDMAKAHGLILWNIVECKDSDKLLDRYTQEHTLIHYTIKGNYSNIEELINMLALKLYDTFGMGLKPLRVLTESILKRAKEESQQRSTTENSLAVNYPWLLNVWNYNKNKIAPEETSKSSGEKVYWKCPTCDNELHETPHYMIFRFDTCKKCKTTFYSFEGCIDDIKPTGLRIKNAIMFRQPVGASSFIELLELLVSYVCYKDTSNMPRIIENKELMRRNTTHGEFCMFKRESSRFRQPKQIGNTGIYMEGKIDSREAIRIIHKIISLCGYQKQIYVKV